MEILKVENLNKIYGKGENEVKAVNNISFSVQKGEFLAIIGASGSGKSTLLHLLGGVDRPTSGKVYIDGKDIYQLDDEQLAIFRRRQVGLIYQFYNLIPILNVEENIALPCNLDGKEVNKKELEELLKTLNLEKRRTHLPNELSGGQQQRVSIGRAIINSPAIMLADEPTGNLDSKNSLEIMNIIKAISKEKLVILVTHEVDLANFYATRIVEVQDGKIVKDYKNETKESLEYRLDNKIYLKDFKEINNINTEKINLNLYSDETSTDKIDVKLVIKNGNIFIQAENRKVEVVDDNSAIELINDHYKKIDKSIYEKYKYNLDEVIDKKYKVRYSSIYGIVKSIKNGFNRIFNYTILKKILLIGFFASAMFIVYSISNIAGVTDIKESDYIQIDKNYLQVDLAKVDVSDYLKYENLENIDYIIPRTSKSKF